MRDHPRAAIGFCLSPKGVKCDFIVFKISKIFNISGGIFELAGRFLTPPVLRVISALSGGDTEPVLFGKLLELYYFTDPFMALCFPWAIVSLPDPD